MGKNRMLQIAVVVLVILNIASLAMQLRPKGRGVSAKKTILEKLSFSNDQIEAFEDLIEIHEQEVQVFAQLERTLKDEMVQKLSQGQEEFDSEIDEIMEVKAKIEGVHMSHLLGIKSLCNGAEQLEKYNELSKDFAKIYAPKQRR